METTDHGSSQQVIKGEHIVKSNKTTFYWLWLEHHSLAAEISPSAHTTATDSVFCRQSPHHRAQQTDLHTIHCLVNSLFVAITSKREIFSPNKTSKNWQINCYNFQFLFNWMNCLDLFHCRVTAPKVNLWKFLTWNFFTSYVPSCHPAISVRALNGYKCKKTVVYAYLNSDM